MSTMTPKEIVHELDRHIIGQGAAKRAVAIALRNRWRRMQLNETLRNKVTPKNILMIGPTGVGKTEIARQLAILSDAPFIKVEATKFTEVGYVGRDVDSIIRELVDAAVKQIREKEIKKMRPRAEELAEEKVLDILLPDPVDVDVSVMSTEGIASEEENKTREKSKTRQVFRDRLRDGMLDDKEIDIEVATSTIGVEIMAPPGMEEMTSQLQNMFQSIGTERTRKRKMKVKDALRVMRDEEASKLINDEELKQRALEAVEQNGIVFIDEIDKIAKRSDYTSGADISREGVQRDLLPLIEGCTVSTKFGMVKTDHILFIASGAFHVTKPSDLIPEMQGRLPIRVELSALTVKDFVLILTETEACLTEQYGALLATEGVTLNFSKEGIQRIAEVAYQVNEQVENIGARRLYTVMERLLETISFEATEKKGEAVNIDENYVNKYLLELVKNIDLSQYIL